MKKYYDISFQLGEDFFSEFKIGLAKVSENPRFFHFDPTGLRRCNLERFPYHFFMISVRIAFAFGYCGMISEDLVLALLDLQTNQNKVLGEGLEPSRLTAPEPKSGVSANFTTRAKQNMCMIFEEHAVNSNSSGKIGSAAN
jgi:hypothetical protein